MNRSHIGICAVLAALLSSGSVCRADESTYQQNRNARIHASFEDADAEQLRAVYRTYEKALVTQKSGNLKEAAKLFRECQQILAGALGANDPMAVDCSANLCAIDLSEKAVGAEVRFKETLAKAEAAIKDKGARDGLKKAAELEKQNKLQESADAFKVALDALVLKGWTPSPDYKAWKDAVGSKVSQIWSASKDAREAAEGKHRQTKVSFSVDRTGELASPVKILHSSGSVRMDNWFAQSIKQASPFSILPHGFPKVGQIEFTCDFDPLSEAGWIQKAFRDGQEFVVSGLSLPNTVSVSVSTTPSTSWDVLILNRDGGGADSGDTKDSDTKILSMAGLFDGSDETDTTICTDGSAAHCLPGVIAKVGNRLVRVSSLQREVASDCKADVLCGKPIGGGKSQTLYGQIESDARRFFRENRVAAERSSDDGGGPISFDSRVSVASIYQDVIGLGIYREPFYPGAVHPEHISEYAEFKNSTQGLVKIDGKKIPAGTKAIAEEALKELPDDQTSDNKPFELRDWVIVPFGLGAVVEYRLPSTMHASSNELFARVPITTNLLPDSRHAVASFMRTHPGFVQWSQLTFLSLAPDQSRMVFVQGGKIYWKKLGERALFLGDANNIRGIQWFPESSVNIEDRKVVGLK